MGNPLANINIGDLGKVVDELITSDEERLQLMQRANEMQAETNQEEAKHSSIFVAGWRPFIGWVCGSAMAFNFILIPIINYLFAAFELDFTKVPELDWAQLMPVVMGMLGLGALRTYEKKHKVSRSGLFRRKK